MIFSKNFLIYGLVTLAACSSPKNETTETADSTKTDAVAIEAATSEETSEGSTFDIDPSLSDQSLTVFGQSSPVIYWLNKVYRPDHWINLDTGAANYKIKSADLTEGEYSTKEGKCAKRSVLLAVREMPGEEYYDVHFLYENAEGNISAQKVTYDGDIAQSTGSISYQPTTNSQTIVRLSRC